jgi:hypothetical protein
LQSLTQSSFVLQISLQSKPPSLENNLRFHSEVEKKLLELDKRVEKLDTLLKLLEKKLDSVPPELFQNVANQTSQNSAPQLSTSPQIQAPQQNNMLQPPTLQPPSLQPPNLLNPTLQPPNLQPPTLQAPVMNVQASVPDVNQADIDAAKAAEDEERRKIMGYCE